MLHFTLLLWCRVIPALGAGAAYGVAQGTPAQAPLMAVGFAGFSALFYKVPNPFQTLMSFFR